MKNILVFYLLFFFMEGVFGKTDELVSVTEGDSVTLHTGLNEIQSSDVIDWNFGQNGDCIARLKETENNITIYDDVLNGIFRGRLKVDSQTGDLTITNIKTTDSGIYEVDSILASSKRFSVTVVSVGQRHSGLMGEFVTLQTGLTDTQKFDVILWKFGPQHSAIAEVNIKTRNVSTFDGPDNQFTDRLQLDYRTGSLTVTNTRTTDSGLYEVDIIKSSSYTIHKTFSVTIRGEVKLLSVKQGESVKIYTDTKIQDSDSILWMFGDTVILSRSIHNAKIQIIPYDVPGGRFRDRLQLDRQSGSLIITNITTEHAGPYKLQMTTSRHTVNKKFLLNVEVVTDLSSGDKNEMGYGVLIGFFVATVAVSVLCCRCLRSPLKNEYEPKVVQMGDPLILKTDAKVHTHVLIQWLHKNTLIATISGLTRKFSIYDEVLNGKFKDRLNLDKKTGSLTITNITTEHNGRYTLKIIKGCRVSFRFFGVTVCDTFKPVPVDKKKPIILLSDLTEINEDDVIQYFFGHSAEHSAELIAQIYGKERPTYYNDERFTGRLKIDQTGSLTITDARTTDSGLYELHIFRSERKMAKLFSVTVSDSTTNRTDAINMPLLS